VQVVIGYPTSTQEVATCTVLLLRYTAHHNPLQAYCGPEMVRKNSLPAAGHCNNVSAFSTGEVIDKLLGKQSLMLIIVCCSGRFLHIMKDCTLTLLHCPRRSQHYCCLPFPCIHEQTMQHCQHPHTASKFSNLT
jgi:hypothetical protein